MADANGMYYTSLPDLPCASAAENCIEISASS
jgi:hypothetical protein